MTDKAPENDELSLHSGTELETDVNNKIYNVAVDEYFLNIKSELNQIDRLVNDAVTHLVINFEYINELSKSQHEAILNIKNLSASRNNKSVLELLNKQIVITDKNEQELQSALTALQFGDLVSQLLAHTTKQIDTLKNALQHIDYISNTSDSKKYKRGNNNKISMAVQLAVTKKTNKPVVQHEVQKGEIELF
ncbi:hypothetical protein SAMN05216302_102826 [Nitrosomonas aestuarii]|uniref:Uncharacterized protein n=1 Tax=Nitrosomonas aestuarii TaxID=52441 RepID=A0A1I4EHJ8_9PROT|nr:hypothetical protein [Nitrosomonas aestuarii]SFL04733.1 hypothetical protein SAMN05216302_102826 [Nitrosomonas aestuarii]